MSSVTENDPAARALQAKVRSAYGSQNRQAQEDQWIVQHLPLVRHVVQKVAGQLQCKIDLENLISAGTLGLVKAARSFDSTKDAEFKTYAYIRIRGSILDELRAESFIPAMVHKQLRLAEAACRRHIDQHGSQPEDEELAAELGIPVAKLYRTLEEARRQQFLSIHGLSADSGSDALLMPIDTAPRPDAQAERKDLVDKLTLSIRQLSTRDRQVLLLYYEQDLTMKEIAEVLEITEARVSQLHASALFKLSLMLKEKE